MTHCTKHIATARRAFTLIELFVVIAIIAILAAILFPVFAKTRDKARQTACLSDTKQIGTGIMMYVQDYDETYPRLALKAADTPERQSWAPFSVFEAVGPYIKNGIENVSWAATDANKPVPLAISGIWVCPSQPFANTWRNYGAHNQVFSTFESGENGSVKFDATTAAAITRPSDLVVMSELGVADGWNTSSLDMSTDW